MNQCNYDLTPVVEDALDRLRKLYTGSTDDPDGCIYIKEAQLEVTSWQQLWGSTTCGFGGIGGAAMTKAQTTVIQNSIGHEVLVYHMNKFAYMLPRPNEKFFGCFEKHQLPGAAERDRIQALSDEELLEKDPAFWGLIADRRKAKMITREELDARLDKDETGR